VLIGIHQPHYLPWLRYFEKIARSDVFIVLDDVQYEKNGFQNRNRIKTAQGPLMLTVPVARPTQRPIREIEIDARALWREAHRRALEMNYGKAPHFADFWPSLASLYDRPWARLADLNRAMLEVFLGQLGIATPLRFSSELAVPGEATERLVNLVRAVGGDAYLSGAYAVQTYLDADLMAAAGIRLAFQEWQAPTYPQLYPKAGFERDLSIVDLLFNAGPGARDILLAAGSVREG